jgi:hypothetical protein
VNAVEFRFYQGIVDALNHEWFPEIYYTLAHGEKVPSYFICAEMFDVLEPFIGDVISQQTELRMQELINQILHDHTMRREILIWTNADGKPLVIDGARVVKSGDYSYRVSPILDRTDIMREVMEPFEHELTGQD